MPVDRRGRILKGRAVKRFIARPALAAALLSPLLFTGCAAPLKDPWGLAALRGEASAAAAPRLVQADLDVRVEAPGTPPVGARFYAEPGRRYRLDVAGFLTPVAATWFWRDGGWLLVRHDTREVVTGTGTSLVLQGAAPLVIPDVHAILGFLWGAPLPGFSGRADSVAADGSGIVWWRSGGVSWTGRFDARTGLCREVSSEAVTMQYFRHGVRGGRVIPGEIRVFMAGEKVLTLEVRDLISDPVWKKDPLVLTIPAGYDTAPGRP